MELLSKSEQAMFAGFVAALLVAESPEAVLAIRQQMGPEIAEGSGGLDELRGDALDYVRELCFAAGVHCSAVGL